jgi:hypothetical protein
VKPLVTERVRFASWTSVAFGAIACRRRRRDLIQLFVGASALRVAYNREDAKLPSDVDPDTTDVEGVGATAEHVTAVFSVVKHLSVLAGFMCFGVF